MCGIAGLIWQDPRRPGDARAAQAMARALAHRGPDGEGVEVVGPAALGHRRLAVIDLSDAARQPISNEDGSIWVTYNGEVYNFRELRADLEARGHTFRSHTDSEVLVHLYEERGADLVEDLRGMFAFALWDARRGKLLLARDRAGQKPLHYRIDRDALRFASEPLALFADPGAPRPTMDPVGLYHYLHYGWVPSPHSAFEGVRKLPPAHVLEWSPGGTARLRRYWKPDLLPKHEVHAYRDEERLCQELQARLDESIRLRLISDVPLGAFLSGGIDSGLVVASMARQQTDPVRSFTIGFPGSPPGEDERAFARQIADRFQTRHREEEVAIAQKELLSTLLPRYGEPFADPSAVPTYRVSQLAREDVTVVLTGEAGDELFGGYWHHSDVDPGRHLGRWNSVAGPAVRGLIDRLPRKQVRGVIATLEGLRDRLQDPILRCASKITKIHPLTAGLLARPAFLDQVQGVDPLAIYRGFYEELPATCRAERALWADFCLYLADCLLVKVDIASMCHGLEARAPFLDHPLVEWALRLPISTKVRWAQTKWLPRRLAERSLPRDVARGPKRGFSIPLLPDWFRGPLRDEFRELLLGPDARTRALLEPQMVERLFQQHLRGEADHQAPLWSLYCLERWFREVLEAPLGVEAG